MNENMEALLVKRISAMPGVDGWWHLSAKNAFIRYGKTLVEHGFSVEEAVELLTELYATVAGEFGD